MRTIAWLFALVLVNAAAGEAAEPVRLAPSSPWNLDYAAEKCRLARTFGDGDEKTLLFFDQYTPSTSATMTIAGRSTRVLGNGREIEVRYGPRDAQGIKVHPTEATFEGYGNALIVQFVPKLADQAVMARSDGGSHWPERVKTPGLPHIAPEDIAGIDWLSLKRGERELILDLQGLGPAIAALNDCTLDLLRQWHLDPDEHVTMTRQAQPVNFQEIAERISHSYTDAATKRGEQADLIVRIIVDADGEIEDCSIIDATITKYIKTPACDVFGKRAMFAPAEDAAGEPIKSYYQAHIVYRIDH